MSHTRALLLTTAIALAIAILAPPATLAGPVEVEDTANEHCDPVLVEEYMIVGGCHLHAPGNGLLTLIRHVPGIGEFVVQSCVNEFSIRVDEQGEGWATGFGLAPGDPICPSLLHACPVGDDSGPWHAQFSHSGSSEFLVMRICLLFPLTEGASCEVEGTWGMEVINTGGEYTLEAENANAGTRPLTAIRVRGAHGISHGFCEGSASQFELDGHWDFEGNPIHINHL